MMSLSMKFEWERLDVNTCRAKVIGGWIIHSVGGDDVTQSESMVFIPDQNHKWRIEK
jgi:hypothetical protein